MGPIIGIIVAVVMALIANSKGFSWWLWVLAGGVPGIIILLCLPAASTEDIDEETRIRRSITIPAPIHAANARPHVATRPVAPTPKTTNAAPKLAPELIPRT